MKILNLEAKTEEEKVLLTYLQENVSDILADKINNGVPVEKDGKQLVSKKTLKGFLSYACNLAKEQAEKGARSACVCSDTVFGWAIHYFEEDSIEGTLYNQDGTEYKPAKAKVEEPKKVDPPKKEKPAQLSLFDEPEEPQEDNEDELEDEVEETLKEPEKSIQEQKQGNALYQRYKNVKSQYKDCLLFIRVGDFYEAFEDDAVSMSRLLDLTLTSREMGLDTRVPMCGVPYHAIDNYVRKLIDNGYRVAMCEALEQPKVIEQQKIDYETGEILNDDALTYINAMFGDYVEVK